MTHSVHFPLLQDIGLNETEALIYEILLEEGPAGGSSLAKSANIGRGNAYNALTSLIQKGLVQEETGPKNIYKATDPEKLRLLAKQHRMAAEAVYDQLESILPSLKSSFRLFTKQPTVRVFEGIEGLKELYGETIKDAQTIYAFVSPDEPAPELFQWLTTHYVKSRIKASISVNVIVNGTSHAADYIAKNKQELREARFIHSNTYPFKGEINVFGDKVAFIAYKADEQIGVLIESAGIATTLRSVVQLLLDTVPQ